ncbi:hypothetical protein PV783_25660 [Chitinophaga sp. CC14]|uniref:hypothetical protein n=1 Tax=Chitinophaga sp. CC14 TaxID=3029199 RepID=UPI003B7DA4AA
MKRARIAIAAVTVGGILAFLLSRPIVIFKYAPPLTITPSTIYDKIDRNQKIIPIKDNSKQQIIHTMLAYNAKT